ncbi:Protein lin-37 like [Pseudolycoriella hygida]|uniref:Protein lin-37 like n=1 Tax=Pseudolycoriella hygida TaxID=35572 RepID=A0A9Q0S7T6_9DIPT|nr:Protein lin-37 like [Pseudolycoriella hygida]
MKNTPKRRGTDVQTARGRLTGALKVAVAPPSDDDDGTDSSLPARGRPPLRPRKGDTSRQMSNQTVPLHQSYIMKLFDRSVDLARYNQNSPLYPICRAWMQNQPRSGKVLSKSKKNSSARKRVAMPDIIKDLKSGEITEIQAMPAGNDKPKIQRIPSPLHFQKESSRDNINLDYDLDDPVISLDDLIADLKCKGRMVRRKWQAQSKAYHNDRFPLSCKVLEEIFKQ